MSRRVVAGIALPLLSAGLVLMLGAANPAEAKKKSKSKGSSRHISAFVVTPAGLETTDSNVVVDEGYENTTPGPVTVSLNDGSPGSHWVHLPLSLPSAVHSGKGKTHKFFIIGVEICHMEEGTVGDPLSASTLIETVRLTEIKPGGGEVVHEDTTSFRSAEQTCSQSLLGMDTPFSSEDPLTLSLQLSFGNSTDVFRFGAIRILISPRKKAEASLPSDPSEASEASH